MPTLNHGAQLPEHSRHILAAQSGRGTSFWSPPYLLRRPNSTIGRQWYNATEHCNPAARLLKPGRACDEYPFFTAIPGGPAFYPATVSLRLLSKGESNAQGGLLGGFYTRCRIRDIGGVRNREFLSFGVPILPNISYCGRRRK